MTTFEDLERRLTALEQRLDQAAYLENVNLGKSAQRATEDPKISATHHLAQALAIIQSQHTEALVELGQSMRLLMDMIQTLIDREEA